MRLLVLILAVSGEAWTPLKTTVISRVRARTEAHPTSASSLREKISRAEAQKEILLMPCCYDGLTARLVEEAGFECTFMTGVSMV